MHTRPPVLIVLFALGFAAPLASAAAESASTDPSHDFDVEIGTWKTHVKRRTHPLSGSDAWVELEGTSVVRKLLDGRANTVELDIAGPSGRIAGVALRLYDASARQWSIHYASLDAGELTPPLFGRFKDGRGEFHGQDTLAGRSILVRFVVECATRDTCRFEQSYSDDGGRHWETNWIATDTRIAPSGEPG
jgi:hypothetical protein